MLSNLTVELIACKRGLRRKLAEVFSISAAGRFAEVFSMSAAGRGSIFGAMLVAEKSTADKSGPALSDDYQNSEICQKSQNTINI